MVLKVDLLKFSEAARVLLGTEEVFLSPRGSGTWVTAGNPAKDVLLACHSPLAPELVRAELARFNLKVYEGEWALHDPGPTVEAHESWVAAVAYRSREPMPGLWMDAYADQPTAAQVLKAMFDEFRENGEVGEVTFEEFVRMAEPNVQILSPSQVLDFAMQKDGC